jgi:hypothetical protein
MIYEIGVSIKTKKYKNIKNCIKSILPSKFVSNMVFLKNRHRLIDYKNPVMMDEKLLILKDGVYRNNPLIVKCTDKNQVRQYIADKGYENILINNYGVYDSADDIEWEKFPEKYVLKCNHGSGYNIIVKDGNINKDEVKKKLAGWLKEDYAVISGEKHYHKIPRKIIAEEFIENKAGELPNDYKFFASRGNIFAILIVSGRGKKKQRIYVDDKFEDLGYVQSQGDYKEMKPESFDRMLEIARELSKDFPFVRVDLYDMDGKVVFGELTFTPHGCNHDYLSDEVQTCMGKNIII